MGGGKAKSGMDFYLPYIYIYIQMRIKNTEIISFSLDTSKSNYKNNNNSLNLFDVDLKDLLFEILSKVSRPIANPKFKIGLRSLTFNTPSTNTNTNVKMLLSGIDFLQSYDLTNKCDTDSAILGTFKLSDVSANNWLSNGSFESPLYPTNTFAGLSTNPLTDWDFSQTGAVAVQYINGSTAWSASGGNPQSGQQLVVFQIGGNVGNNSMTLFQDGIYLEEGTYQFQGYFWCRTGAPAGNFFLNTLLIDGMDFLTFNLPVSQHTPLLVTETFIIDTDGTYTFQLFSRGGDNTMINMSQFQDNFAIYKLDIQTPTIKGNECVFQVDRYGNTKKQLKMEIQDIDTDTITNINVPNMKADFFVQYIKE